MSYRLTCRRCDFVDRVETVEEAFEIENVHQREHGNDHFVEMIRVENGGS